MHIQNVLKVWIDEIRIFTAEMRDILPMSADYDERSVSI